MNSISLNVEHECMWITKLPKFIYFLFTSSNHCDIWSIFVLNRHVEPPMVVGTFIVSAQCAVRAPLVNCFSCFQDSCCLVCFAIWVLNKVWLSGSIELNYVHPSFFYYICAFAIRQHAIKQPHLPFFLLRHRLLWLSVFKKLHFSVVYVA